MSELPILLAGEGANRFAALRGIEPFDVPAAVSRDGQHDTVGCVARDQQGRVAVATSTGGLTHQMPGRVGDAPLPGCGFYADDHVGGVAVSGDGESIARILLASRVIDALYRHPAQPAVLTALEGLARVGGEAGIIALDSEGRFGIAHNSKHFALAVDASWLRQPIAGICSEDFERSLDG
ncbi:MAG: isoaspartyl peptidase/L-asparaginase [Sphingomonas sp.]